MRKHCVTCVIFIYNRRKTKIVSDILNFLITFSDGEAVKIGQKIANNNSKIGSCLSANQSRLCQASEKSH